jgi:hypothetical protein
MGVRGQNEARLASDAVEAAQQGLADVPEPENRDPHGAEVYLKISLRSSAQTAEEE